MPETNPRTALGSGAPFLRPLWERSLSALFPPQCLKCGAMMEADGALCGSYWPEVTFIGAPQCAACGRPFEYDIGEAALCGACARSRPR